MLCRHEANGGNPRSVAEGGLPGQYLYIQKFLVNANKMQKFFMSETLHICLVLFLQPFYGSYLRSTLKLVP